ncbi:hypothetical protein SEA_RUBYRALPH_77 [Microbacterium phage RubyRalph]|nr:hypothetical protein SEA_RUBYRALPH_77 [Microbacterium phage RubyRalph]
MRSDLTPYDTGKRAEPRPWAIPTRDQIATAEPIDRGLLEDRFGKVDFDDDESSTIVTVWVEHDVLGRPVVHIQEQHPDVTVRFHS